MSRADFLQLMTRVAVARQTQPLDDAALEVYFDELGFYTDHELREAARTLCANPYRNFPTVGDFVVAMCGERKIPLPKYNPYGRHADYLPKTMRPEEFHARRKRGWVPADVRRIEASESKRLA